MKSIKHFSFAIVLALTTIISSCSKSDSDGGNSGPATGSFVKANVIGSGFLSEGQLAVGSYSNGSLVLTGSTTTGKSIGIQLFTVGGNLAVGTYNLSASQDASVLAGGLTFIDINLSTFASVSYSSVNCENTNGSVQITFIDATKIEGKFSFVGKEVKEDESCNGATKNITNGTFRLVL